MSPEMLLDYYDIDAKTDIWAVGILATCFYRRQYHSLFDDGDTNLYRRSYSLQLINIMKIFGVPTRVEMPEVHRQVGLLMEQVGLANFGRGLESAHQEFRRIHPALNSLLNGLLAVVPARRVSAAQALQHRFFEILPHRLFPRANQINRFESKGKIITSSQRNT